MLLKTKRHIFLLQQFFKFPFFHIKRLAVQPHISQDYTVFFNPAEVSARVNRKPKTLSW